MKYYRLDPEVAGGIGEGSVLVFCVHNLAEGCKDTADRYLIAVLQPGGGGEEPAEGIDAKGCLHPLTIADAGYGREV